MRVLMVCLGNICRSPTAEAVLSTLAPDWEVDSAGTGAWHLGDPPHRQAQAAASRRGYDMARSRARRVEAGDFDRFDLILAMDRENLADLKAMRPAHARAELGLLLDHADGVETRDVPDPYFTGGFEMVLDLIEQACRGLVAAPPALPIHPPRR